MEKLAKPPIIEAQIGFKLSKSMGLDAINQMADVLKTRYPSKKPRFEIKATISAESGKIDQQNSDFAQQGLQVANDKGFVAIFQRDLIIFCSLAPYPGWEDFKTEVLVLLELLNDHVSSVKFSECFSRYINSIKLSAPLSLDEYFTFLPTIPPVGPALTLNGFNYQFAATQNDTGFKTSVSFFPRPHMGQVSSAEFMLDLGVSKSIDAVGITKALWDDLETARVLKNALFFGLTTEKLRERYS